MNLLRFCILYLTYKLSFGEITWNVGDPLYIMPTKNLTQTGANLILYVRLCQWSISNGSELLINMTRYCYCTHSNNDSSCQFPGPTLSMHEDTIINVTIVNQLNGSNITYGPGQSSMNDYKDMDTTNLHGGAPLDDYSMCDIYCKFPMDQRDVSGYHYDVQTNISYNRTKLINSVETKLMLFFVNGQLSPIIPDLTVNYWRRLRMINSLSNWFLQMRFPDECDWRLIATDGVYINSSYINYNLSNTSHYNEVLIQPGQRNDIMVKCTTPGIYPIYASNNNTQDPDFLNALQRVYDGRLLFSINVTTDASNENPGTQTLPNSYPPKNVGSYIQDLSTLNSVSSDPLLNKTCHCNFENPSAPGPSLDTKCEFAFRLPAPSTNFKMSVNWKAFNITDSSSYPYLSDSLSIIEKNRAYEYILNNDADNITTHVYHQHINPFQVQKNIGKNGFIALPLTWWDTLGNNPAVPGGELINIRFWTRDYVGLIIIHCHLLQHEDQGMMGFYNIVPSVDANSCPNSPAAPLTTEAIATTDKMTTSYTTTNPTTTQSDTTGATTTETITTFYDDIDTTTLRIDETDDGLVDHGCIYSPSTIIIILGVMLSF